MTTKSAVSVEEYLRTSYEYDPEYVDGELVERSLPTIAHALVLSTIIASFSRMRNQCRLFSAPDVRIPVKFGSWRVPDLIIFADEVPAGRYPSAPPAGVIEILSPDDRLETLITKLDEYSEFGIPHAWLVDPEHRRVYKHECGDLIRVNAIEFPERGFRLDASEIFA